MNVWSSQLSNGSWLVGVRGRLDQDLTPALEAELRRLLDEGHSRLIVELSQATYINSGGLRALVAAWRKARQQGGDLVLCGLTPRLAEIIGMVGFDKVFKIFPDRAAAEQAALAG